MSLTTPEQANTERGGWVSIQDAATHWSLSTKTIRRYIKAGRVEAVRVGPRAIRVNLQSLDALGAPVE